MKRAVDGLSGDGRGGAASVARASPDTIPVSPLFPWGRDYLDEVVERFEFSRPERFNIAEAVCLRHADGSARLAMIAEDCQGRRCDYSFDDVARYSAQVAALLQRLGIGRGDRVAVILPQRIETALLHVAAHRIGAVSLPLSVLFGVDALAYRLRDSGARVVLTDREHIDLLASVASMLPDLHAVLEVPNTPASVDARQQDDERSIDQGRVAIIDLDQHVGDEFAAPRSLELYASRADDPAFLLYTSGTTGPPKGALIPHCALIGNLPGFELSHDGFPEAGDRVFTPADWAWTGGLLDALMPAWYYGMPVVAFEQRGFDAERVLSIMSRHRVRCAFLPPTALKLLRAQPQLFERYPLVLRSVMSAGEALGAELHEWGRRTLGLSINEMCGQTEHNYLIGGCNRLYPARPGSMGKVYPGHRVAVFDTDGQALDDDETGELVVHRDDPVHFLGYWQRDAATAEKYSGDWFHTGDMVRRDADGYLWFVGRADDVITSAGYRIGPGEIENCAIEHPDILQAAAIGVPDPEGLRGDVVKLVVVLRDGRRADESCTQSIRRHIRERVAKYQYPRLIEYVDALPMTTTGKIQRAELRRQHEASQAPSHEA